MQDILGTFCRTKKKNSSTACAWFQGSTCSRTPMDRQTNFAERCIINDSALRPNQMKIHSVKCNLIYLHVNFEYISFFKERD